MSQMLRPELVVIRFLLIYALFNAFCCSLCFLVLEVLVLLGSFQSDVPECSDESGSTNITMIILCTQC